MSTFPPSDGAFDVQLSNLDEMAHDSPLTNTDEDPLDLEVVVLEQAQENEEPNQTNVKNSGKEPHSLQLIQEKMPGPVPSKVKVRNDLFYQV